MSMLTQTKELLKKEGAFTGEQNEHLQKVIEAISFPTIDPRMKSVVAVAQITAFASQFRRNIDLWDDVTEVPINAISFVITGSGAGKDSSVKAARKCFKSGYKLIEQAATAKAVKLAIEEAKEEGLPNPEDEAMYRSYLKPVPPIDIMPTTGPGLIQHINDIGEIGLGAGFMYSGEFSDELAYNQDMVENIKTLSEIYDTGDKEVKYTKSLEFRSKAINGQPVSALFVGSPGHILYDEATKKKFHIAFMSKLARRSWFCYAPDKIDEQVFNTLEEFWEYEEAIENESKHARIGMDLEAHTIAEHNLQFQGKGIGISKEVERLFKTYKRYNNDLADLLPNQESTYALIRRHLQWKALKLAGAFTIMKCEHEISPATYVEAIRFCETLDKDMEVFERDLNKSPHELLVDYFHTKTLVDGLAEVSTHDLKKQGFMNNVSKPKLKEMVALCAGYDRDSVYSVVNDGAAIQYEPIIKTDVINITYKEIDCSALNAAIQAGDYDKVRQTKHDIATTVNYGFDSADITFADLPQLLAHDYAFSPFRFKDGVRRKENLESGTKWVVLDIDDSPLSAEEAHMMLGDINHHIALTSDNSNNFKFRVLLELDSEVFLDPIAWKHFYLKIADDLGLRADPLPQAQIFYSYAGRKVLSNLDAVPIETRDYLMYAKDKAADREQQNKVMSTAQKRAQLNDPTTTFEYAFEARHGEGSRSMYRMMRHAQDLGATQEEVLQLLEDVNTYWDSPMPEERLDKLRDQGRRLF
jgi:hypothetical protein